MRWIPCGSFMDANKMFMKYIPRWRSIYHCVDTWSLTKCRCKAVHRFLKGLKWHPQWMDRTKSRPSLCTSTLQISNTCMLLKLQRHWCLNFISKGQNNQILADFALQSSQGVAVTREGSTHTESLFIYIVSISSISFTLFCFSMGRWARTNYLHPSNHYLLTTA